MFIPPPAIIGILGGGQLGKMLAMEAARLGYQTHVYDPSKDSPAKQVATYKTTAPFEDTKALQQFAQTVAVATVEFENIPLKTLETVEAIGSLFPSSFAIAVCQDRLREKAFLQKLGITTPPWCALEKEKEDRLQDFSYPAYLKTAQGGYNGKAQALVRSKKEALAIWETWGKPRCILEEKILFSKEMASVIGVGCGETLLYPLTETLHQEGILHKAFVPSTLPATAQQQAYDITHRIVKALSYQGVLAVELFYLKGEVLVNELAPRVHNSAHWTWEGAITSQFEQHIRAICGLPLGDIHLLGEAVEMTNLLGKMDGRTYLKDPYTSVHLYGKKDVKAKRKMGHVTTIKPRQ